MKYVIASENESYFGKVYTFQGERYAVFVKNNGNEKPKYYKSLKVAEKVCDRLKNTCINCNMYMGYNPQVKEVEDESTTSIG